ncbi:MAG TPA: GreA/GreB family elongation factor [Planctomycetota bacterium]|nr:GreA/GreB family elongation factor [Planctomycetota bacterium]
MSGIVEQLAAAVARADYGAVESLWLELLEAEALPAEDLARVLRRLVDAGQGARALDLVLALAPELLRAERYAEALPLARAVAEAARGNEELRTVLLTCYRRVHDDVPHLGACVDRSGLLTQEDLGAATAILDRLLSYRKGDYFYHAAGWGMGRIAAFDSLTARATVDFERKPGHQVPLENIEGVFVRLRPEGFLVLRKTDPERLRQVATEDPARLVRMAIEAMDGRLSSRGLRDLVEGQVVPAEGWGKWWTTARAALRRDPYVTLGGGSNPVLTLRAQPLSYEEEMSRRFAALKDLEHLTGALAEYTQNMDKEADPEAFLLPAARAIAARIAAEPSRGAALEAALLLTRLKLDPGPFPTPEQIAEQHAHDPIPLLNGLAANNTRAHVFRMLRDKVADRRGMCYQVLLVGPPSLWDAAADELPEEGDPPTIRTFVHEVLADPKRRLELFAWVCRNLLLGRWKTEVPPSDVFERLLTEGDVLARRKTHQRGEWTPFHQADELAEIRQSLRAGDLRYFDGMLKEMSETEAARLYFRVHQSSVLPAHFAHVLEQKMVRRFPKLLVEEEHRAEAAAVEYLYSTAQAIARRRKDHDHIVNVLIPRNSEDIARAKESGDLTDNADFRAAIQEQHVLNARAIEMGEELLRARPIEPAMVHTEHVSIGSRVTVENAATGERRVYSILGPWDSDAEHGTIAYVAPLAQALLRHRAGDEVAFSHAGEAATYRILEVGSALEPPASESRP